MNLRNDRLFSDSLYSSCYRLFFILFICLCNLIFYIRTEKPLLELINKLVYHDKYLVNQTV